jgi:hypothetical protein
VLQNTPKIGADPKINNPYNASHSQENLQKISSKQELCDV